ncbi:MAG: hypothetical protein VR68_12120 [Peptococcaceae bacterium BRH_c4a]|nr:MAG: hypothetical protein VR68_12120 [Peptococcaceae bacterium BRH_c4a]
MLMQGILNATDVRREWGKFIDTVVHEKPGVVKRNRDCFLSLSINHAMALLKDRTFKARFVTEGDGSVTATLDNFDLVVNEKDETSAKKALAEELVEYANEYFKDFQLYYNSLNRQPHFPYVLKVLIQNDISGVVSLIDA